MQKHNKLKKGQDLVCLNARLLTLCMVKGTSWYLSRAEEPVSEEMKRWLLWPPPSPLLEEAKMSTIVSLLHYCIFSIPFIYKMTFRKQLRLTFSSFRNT